MNSSTSLVSLRSSRQAMSILRNNNNQSKMKTQGLPPKRHSDGSSRSSGLFRRSRSFAAQRSAAAATSTTTDGSPTSPVRKAPYRSRSGGAAALLQRQHHLRQHYYPTSTTTKASQHSDEEMMSPEEDPCEILRQYCPTRSLPSSPITRTTHVICTELPLLHSSSSPNHNNPRNNLRLHRLLYLCFAMGITGLWMSMKLVVVKGDHSLHHLPLSEHERHTQYWQLLLLQHITTTDRLDDPLSPAHEALQWLVDSSSSTTTTIVPSEVVIQTFALATLYFATHSAGSLWIHGEQEWAHTRNCCDWYGITCNTEGTVVQKIELGSNFLQGTIPFELFAGLKQLQVLDLSYNSLWGSLPENWNTLPSLRKLYLQNNALTGTMPQPPQSTSSATVVWDLSHNEFVEQE